MGITIRRIFAYLVEAALLLFAGGRLILDLIGWSTVPDDVGVAVSWVERFAAWLISVPWWVTYGSATAGLMGLIYFSWPRPVYLPAPPTDPAMTASTPKGLTDAAPLALPASPALEIAAPVEASINPTSIYVGEMRVATAKALDERKIEISARCFNASGQTLTVQGVTGYVSGELRENGREPVSLGDMPLPWLIDTIDVTTWQDQTEMLIVLNQRISVGVPDAIQSLREGQSIFLTLDKLNVLIASKEKASSAPVRLALWNGIRLWRSNDLQAGRIIMASMGAII